MINSLAKDVQDHCEVMIEEAQKTLESNRHEYDPDIYVPSDAYEQGRKDALRVILLVLKDHEDA